MHFTPCTDYYPWIQSIYPLIYIPVSQRNSIHDMGYWNVHEDIILKRI